MARTLAFDRDTAARAARQVFWRDGFESASIPALETATGLSRSSIYNAFGSKRGLFDAAVESYLDEIVRPRLAGLLAEPIAPEALDAYLAGLGQALENAAQLPASHGCLLVNSASSPIGADPHIAEVIEAYRAELASAFDRGLAAADPHLPEPQRTVRGQAVTGLVIAAFAMVRTSRPQACELVKAARTVARGQG